MKFDLDEFLTITFTLFAVIDIIGSIPLLISLKEKMGGINEARATIISGGLMVLFLFVGEPFLHLLGLDHKRLTYRFRGRDFRLTDVGGRVVHEILA